MSPFTEILLIGPPPDDHLKTHPDHQGHTKAGQAVRNSEVYEISADILSTRRSHNSLSQRREAHPSSPLIVRVVKPYSGLLKQGMCLGVSIFESMLDTHQRLIKY